MMCSSAVLLSQPVTEDDASPKKKRVQVKKYRKRTPAERRSRGGKPPPGSGDEIDGLGKLCDEARAGDGDGEEGDPPAATIVVGGPSDVGDGDGDDEVGSRVEHEAWWSEEEGAASPPTGSAGDDDEKPMVVYISSDNLEALVDAGETANEDCADSSANHALMVNGGETKDEASAGDLAGHARRPTVVCISESPEQGDEAPSSGEDELTPDRGVEDAIRGESQVNTSTVAEPSENGAGQKNANAKEKDCAGADDSNVVGAKGGHDDKGGSPVARAPAEHKTSGDRDAGVNDGGVGTDPPTVSLAPKVLPQAPPPTDDVARTSPKEGGGSRGSPTSADAALEQSWSDGPDIPPLLTDGADTPSQRSYLTPRALSPQPPGAEQPSPGIYAIEMPDLSSDDDSGKGGVAKKSNMDSIFRGSDADGGDGDDDDMSIPEIHACGSSVTEVTSNIECLKEAGSSYDASMPEFCTVSTNDAAVSSLFPPYQLDPVSSGGSSDPSSLGAPVPLQKVQSHKSTDLSLSSNVSYLSYEEVSIASDELEMCAICLCPYEEGDIRIFSKKCVHVFHKECILEWLVNSHNECPCCRVDMVTMSEIKETSAALIGTERLAQAMAVVSGSQMQEAPPLRRTSRLARQMLDRARAQRRRSGRAQRRPPPGGESTAMSPRSPNAHWLWTERFNNSQPNTSPGTGPSLMRSVNEGETPTTSPPTPRRRNGAANDTHNRDWLWATRFNSFSSNDDQQPRTINPSRSSDAIMNPYESNMRPDGEGPSTPTSTEAGGRSMHNTAAGALFVPINNSMYHDHWARRNPPPRRSNAQQPVSLTLSPRRVHQHWRQQPSIGSNPEPTLPVTVLPAI